MIYSNQEIPSDFGLLIAARLCRRRRDYFFAFLGVISYVEPQALRAHLSHLAFLSCP